MTTYFEDDQIHLHLGEALSVLQTLETESVDCVVTSPPYFGLRDYGVPPTDWPELTYSPMPGSDPIIVPAMSCPLGLEPDVVAYVGHLRLILLEVNRVLAKDGTLWLNLGDSWASSAGWGRGGGSRLEGGQKSLQQNTPRKSDFGVRRKNLIGIPWRVVFAMQGDGWILRSDVIWNKPNPMPENVKDRPTSSYEHVFLLSKEPKYFYDGAAIAEQATGRSSGNGFNRPEQIGRGGPGSDSEWVGRPQLRRAMELAKEHNLTEEHFAAIRAVGMNDAGKAKKIQGGSGNNAEETTRLAAEAKTALGGYYREFLTGATKNARDVWTISTKPFPEAHFAAMAPALATRCITAGCKPGGTVLDPFSGSGTTGMVALEQGRRYVGIELSQEYLDLSLRTRFANGIISDTGVSA